MHFSWWFFIIFLLLSVFKFRAPGLWLWFFNLIPQLMVLHAKLHPICRLRMILKDLFCSSSFNVIHSPRGINFISKGQNLLTWRSFIYLQGNLCGCTLKNFLYERKMCNNNANKSQRRVTSPMGFCHVS